MSFLLKRLSLLVLFFLATHHLVAEPAATQHSLAIELGNIHLGSFQVETAKQEVQKKVEKPKSFFTKMTGLDDPNFTITQLSPYESHALFYQKVFSDVAFSQGNVLNKNSWKDLELLKGDHTPQINLINLFQEHLVTTAGSTYLAYTLSNPSDNIQVLQTKQEIVKTLLLEAPHKRLHHALLEVQKTESALLYFWKEETNKANKMFLENLYYTNNWPILGNLKKLNQSTYYQEFSTQFNHLAKVTLPIIILPTALSIQLWKQVFPHLSYVEAMKVIGSGIKEIIVSPEVSIGTKAAVFGPGALLLAYQGLIIKMGYDEHIRYCNLLNFLHEQTNGVAATLQALEEARKLMVEFPTLRKLHHAQTILNFSARTEKLSAKMEKLAGILNTNTFKGKPSIASLKGRVRAAYSILKDVKTELVPALLAVGELDAMLATAKLYQKFEGQKVQFTFPTYAEGNAPSIHMSGMWNPFVSVDKVVENSLVLGGAMPQNVILTGPNAGGKSTFLKGTCLSILLAQTIGIAPVKELTFTPFAKINTYMNITDDTAGGNSLFKSEVLRAQSLLETVKNLNSKKFSLSIMDEMFSGTSPKEGEAATYAVAKRLGELNNSILLLATHFPKLKELADKAKTFKNYQVRVVYHEDKTFSYPFKLEEGFADQNVAIAILQQQGFDASILDDANAILAQ